MALRLAAIAIGSQFGVTETIGAILVAQALATAAVSAVGIAAFRRFPAAPAEPLAADSEGLRAFVLQSSAATGLLSVRSALAPLLPRRRCGACAGRPLPHRAGTAGRLCHAQLARSHDHAHGADAGLGTRRDRAGPPWASSATRG